MSARAKRMARALHTAIGGGLLLAAGLVHAGTVHYYYTDPQGTVLAKADAHGTIVARYDYAPYGTSAPNLDAAPAGPGYTGHVNDPDTGLVYMQARYYDPVVGRFLSVDPVGPAPGNTFNFNRYAYADNSPIVHDDPTGAYSRLVSDDDRNRGASDTGVEGSNAEDDGDAGLTNRGGTLGSSRAAGSNKEKKVVMNDKERTALSEMSYRDSRMKHISSENYFFMDSNGGMLGMSNKGCEGAAECTVDSSPLGTSVLGHNHVYPEISGPFQRQTANMYREFPGPGDASPLGNGWLSAIFMPSGARYAIDGTLSSPQIHYLGGGNSAFGQFVIQKWHPNITPEEIAKDIEIFHSTKH